MAFASDALLVKVADIDADEEGVVDIDPLVTGFDTTATFRLINISQSFGAIVQLPLCVYDREKGGLIIPNLDAFLDGKDEPSIDTMPDPTPFDSRWRACFAKSPQGKSQRKEENEIQENKEPAPLHSTKRAEEDHDGNRLPGRR